MSHKPLESMSKRGMKRSSLAGVAALLQQGAQDSISRKEKNFYQKVQHIIQSDE